MTTVKLKIKINNSYESEPSSGSGSSISEVNDYEHCTVEDTPNLPLMLNPSFYSMIKRVPPAQTISKEELANSASIKRYNSQISSSQESDFEGFTESETGSHQQQQIKVHRNELRKFDKLRSVAAKTSSQESDFEGFGDVDSETGSQQRQIDLQRNELRKFEKLHSVVAKSDHAIGTNKNLYRRFYDVIIEQNSCNAVDMQLSGESHMTTEEPSSELSFNGKIRHLTSETTDSVCDKRICHSPKVLKTILETTETSNYKYTNERSPDLFDDNDDADSDEEGVTNASALADEECVTDEMNKSLNCPTESSFADENNENTLNDDEDLYRKKIRVEKELLRRIKTCLAGIPPPPSLTIPQLDMFSVIAANKEKILNFNSEVKAVGSAILCEKKSLFTPSHSVEDVKAMPWEEILGVRQHGLTFNVCRSSESIELLSLAVIERYIGAETTTSYTATSISSPSSAKKRNQRLKMLTKSPGNRLSHLASNKRRAAFSSANLATSSQKQATCSVNGKQILLEKKKAKSRRKGTTPKRMTPSSKKKCIRKTPSSSARKRLFFRSENVKPGPSRETSKRALFQSPAKQQMVPLAVPKPTFKPEVANRVEKSKRALFSPDKSSQSSVLSSTVGGIECGSFSQTSQTSLFGGNSDSLILKRKRTDDDVSGFAENSKKILRLETENLTPRSLKFKSQSFCIGAGTTNSNMLRSNSNISTTSVGVSSGRSITRAASDTTFSSSHLTENHRKKLLWAVSQALQGKQITVSHASFKQYASVLARVVKRLFQEFYQKSSCSTSETMLRLAKKYVYNVIIGNSADDIYLQAKSKLDDEKRMSTTRLSGYIAPDEYEHRKVIAASQSSFCSYENSMDSFSFSQASSLSLAHSTQLTHSTQNLEKISTDDHTSISAMKLSIQPNAALQNSSSKNNLGGIALRENVDCEQRRSAQKNFTGKDQRNVSPYIGGRTSKPFTSCGGKSFEPNSSTARAKRQISFDS